MKKGLLGVGSLAVVTATALMTVTPVCGQLFGCGCTFADGMSYCNIRDPATADCPWCSYGMSGFYIPFGAIMAVAAAATVGALVWSCWLWWAGAAGGLLGYLAGAVLVGWLTALYRGYPIFLGWRL